MNTHRHTQAYTYAELYAHMLAHMDGVDLLCKIGAVSQDSVAEGGLMREYMCLSELVCLLNHTLFVHGQLIGNHFHHCPGLSVCTDAWESINARNVDFRLRYPY